MLEEGHRHVHAETGSSQPASHYTKELCDRILDGLEMYSIRPKIITEMRGADLIVFELR